MNLKMQSTAALTLAALLSACGGDDGGGAQPPAPNTDAETTPDAADAPDATPPPEGDAAPTDAAPDAEPVPVGACGAVRVVDFTAETALIEGDTWTLETESDPAGESTLEGACGGGNGAEVALRFVTPEAGTWRVLVTPADPDAELDTVLYAREGCLDPETELDCNDDFDYPARTDSRVVFDAEAGAEVFLIVDAYAGADDPRGGAVRVEARRLTEVARGGACDPLGLEDTCAVGDFCFASPDANEAPVCAESTPPAATSGRATLLDTQLGLTVEGTDTSRNAEGAYVTLYQGDTVMTLLDGTEAEGLIIEPLEGVSIFGLETITLQSAADLAEVVGDAAPDRVEVTLFDTELEESASLSLPVGIAQTLALGAPCDAARLHDRCAEGTACRDASGAGLFTCEVITAPTLTALNAWYDDQAGRLAVEFVGVDPERDVAAPGVTLLDTNGVDIAIRADGMVGEAIVRAGRVRRSGGLSRAVALQPAGRGRPRARAGLGPGARARRRRPGQRAARHDARADDTRRGRGRGLRPVWRPRHVRAGFDLRCAPGRQPDLSGARARVPRGVGCGHAHSHRWRRDALRHDARRRVPWRRHLRGRRGRRGACLHGAGRGSLHRDRDVPRRGRRHRALRAFGVRLFCGSPADA